MRADYRRAAIIRLVWGAWSRTAQSSRVCACCHHAVGF